MMTFSYEWQRHPVLYDSATRLDFQVKGNVAMCLAITRAKEELADSVGMDGTLCGCACMRCFYLQNHVHMSVMLNLCGS